MLTRIRAILRDKSYVLYTEPYKLNIVGFRGRTSIPNKFDDEIHVFYKKPDGKWDYHIYPVTTDPGTFWLNNPAYDDGTAILAEGQYIDAYELGMHKGLYEALIQAKPVTIIRDYDRDSFLDFYNGVKQAGQFGINIHRAESVGTTAFINRYSAGCQVFQKANDFAEFLALCQRHKSLYGNRFTYALIDFRSKQRILFKHVIKATTIISLIVAWFIKNTD